MVIKNKQPGHTANPVKMIEMLSRHNNTMQLHYGYHTVKRLNYHILRRSIEISTRNTN